MSTPNGSERAGGAAALERLRARPRPEARQEVLIAPGERAGPLAITRSVLEAGGGHSEGTRGLEAALGAPGEPRFLGDDRGCFLCPNCLG